MEDLETFLAVIESGGQTAAARRLGRSLQSVNRSLLALERSVGSSWCGGPRENRLRPKPALLFTDG